MLRRLDCHEETIRRKVRAGQLPRGHLIRGQRYFRKVDVNRACAGRGQDSEYTISRNQAAERLRCSLETVSRNLVGRRRGREKFYREIDVAKLERFKANSRPINEQEFRQLLGGITREQFALIWERAKTFTAEEDEPIIPRVIGRGNKADHWYFKEAKLWSAWFQNNADRYLGWRYNQYVTLAKARQLARSAEQRELEKRRLEIEHLARIDALTK